MQNDDDMVIVDPNLEQTDRSAMSRKHNLSQPDFLAPDLVIQQPGLRSSAQNKSQISIKTMTDFNQGRPPLNI